MGGLIDDEFAPRYAGDSVRAQAADWKLRATKAEAEIAALKQQLARARKEERASVAEEMSFENSAMWVCCTVFYLGLVTGWYSYHPSPELYNPDAVIHGFLLIVLPRKISQWRRTRKKPAQEGK